MTKKRVNISIDETVLAELDQYANMYHMTRSDAIVELFYSSYDSERKCLNFLNAVKDFSHELKDEIDNTSRYEDRQSMKADAFYQLYGYINHVNELAE